MIRTLSWIFAVVTIALVSAWYSPRCVAEQITGDVPAVAPTSQATEPSDAAEAAFSKGDTEGALKILQEAVKKNPELPPAQVEMARLFAKYNAPAGIRPALERAVMDAPKDPEAYLMLGNVAMAERRVTEGALLFQKADSLTGDWKAGSKRKQDILTQIQGGLAMTCEVRNDLTGAQRHIEAWLKLDPKSSVALQRLARCFFLQKKPTEALAKLQEAAKLNPELLTPQAILGQWFAQAGDQKQANTWMIAARNAAPNDAKTRLAVAEWALTNGLNESARKEADEAIRLDPKSPQAQNLRGVIALFDKDYPRAERYFLKARDDAPSEMKFNVTNNLAMALVAQNDESKKGHALTLAMENARKYPRMVEALSTYGWVAYRNGQLDVAENLLGNLAKNKALTPDSAYFFACVLKDRGQIEGARQWLKLSLAIKAPFQYRSEATELLKSLPEASATEKPAAK
ncbi:MAG: tetratricopeptide repeat protein [Thermoguttaceae bacterium]